MPQPADPVEIRPDMVPEAPARPKRASRTTLRLVVDTLIALMLVAILGGVVWHYRQSGEQNRRHAQVHRALARLHQLALLHGGLGHAELSEEGFPIRIDPAWLGGQPLPTNAALLAAHPWLDVAPPGDRSLHPPDPVASNSRQAGFWYNPNRGIIRARVPEQVNREKTLALYNLLNSVELAVLPVAEAPDRKPLPNPEVSLVEADVTPAPALEHVESPPRRRSLRSDASR